VGRKRRSILASLFSIPAGPSHCQTQPEARSPADAIPEVSSEDKMNAEIDGERDQKWRRRNKLFCTNANIK
jgi:hypothetical protein